MSKKIDLFVIFVIFVLFVLFVIFVLFVKFDLFVKWIDSLASTFHASNSNAQLIAALK